MITLRNKGTRRRIGPLSEDLLQFLIGHLEDDGDHGYIMRRSQVQSFKECRADPGLVTMLEKALGDCDQVAIVWERT
ncbi:MAG: hypothetical protein WCN95_07535 [bacterium]